MATDLVLDDLSDEELSHLERSYLRELSGRDELSMGHRTRLATNFVRAVVERSIREHERRIGIRHTRG